MALRWFPPALEVIVSAPCGTIGSGAVPRFAGKYQSGVNSPRQERLKCLIPLQSVLPKRGKFTPSPGTLSRAQICKRSPEEP